VLLASEKFMGRGSCLLLNVFDNTDMEGTPSIVCQHVSGFRTYRS